MRRKDNSPASPSRSGHGWSRDAAQLQDDVALILHRTFDSLPADAKAALQQLRRCDPLLSGRKIVAIDDDIRNIFSLTSALEEHGVELHYAESGRSGIELLQRMPDVDAVLVDIMMPGMDGYETIQEIRDMPEFRALPVIAVTAKAMKGDRQKCIEAGANRTTSPSPSTSSNWCRCCGSGSSATDQSTASSIPALTMSSPFRPWRGGP